MSFFECEFPRTILFKRKGSVAGWSTTVNQGFSASESRNKNWSNSRGKWQIGLKTPQELDAQRQLYVDLLTAFHDVVSGRGDGFRFFDHLANKATSQAIVTYNGNPQLAITRSIGGRNYTKIITKPITAAISDYQGNALTNTVVLSADHVTPVTVDPTTGIVSGQTAGTLVDFQYHIPVRFDSDTLDFVVEESFVKGGRPLVSLDIAILEVFPPNY